MSSSFYNLGLISQLSPRALTIGPWQAINNNKISIELN